MEVVNFFLDMSAWKRDELFFPLRRYFGPYEDNPYTNKSYAEIKAAFLKAVHADRCSSFDPKRMQKLEGELVNETLRFRDDFEQLLPSDFKVLLLPMKSDWEYVMKNLDGTWGVTFPTCIVLGAHPTGDLSRLRRTLHHEANHSIRLQFVKDNHCFLDRIILEGLAETYVDEKFPADKPSKYVVAASEVEVSQWVPKLSEFWRDETFTAKDFSRYLYGSEQFGIPKWLGYAAGYRIVKEARTHRFRTLDWSDLIRVPAEQFLVSCHNPRLISKSEP